MAKILCFCWNTDNIPLCEEYLDGKSEKIVYPNKCFNPLFFDAIHIHILKYQPEIIVISTENEPTSGSFFHSTFLRNMMPKLGYKLITTDSYESPEDQSNELSMSIYGLASDNSISAVELNKGFIFNDNKFVCDKVYNSQPKALVLYLKTFYGTFAFVAVQMSHNYKQQGLCIKSLEDKFLLNKNLNYAFLMGDFANDIPIDRSDLDTFRKETSYGNEGQAGQSLAPNYSKIYENHTVIGYHDRIYHETLNGYPIDCLEYLSIIGNSDKNLSYHMGTMGIYNFPSQ